VSDAVSIVAVVGNPRAGSRTRLVADAFVQGIAKIAEAAGQSATTETIDLADLAGELFSYPSASVDAALATATGARVLVVASPPTRRPTRVCSKCSWIGWARTRWTAWSACR